VLRRRLISVESEAGCYRVRPNVNHFSLFRGAGSAAEKLLVQCHKNVALCGQGLLRRYQFASNIHSSLLPSAVTHIFQR